MYVCMLVCVCCEVLGVCVVCALSNFRVCVCVCEYV